MVRDGIYYAAACFVFAMAALFLASWKFAIPFYMLGLFCLYFFRDPDRQIPDGPVAVSPADGKVVAVVEEPGNATRVSIFLSIFDVHVNRSPIAGTISDVQYQKGSFHVASREIASAQNEMNTVTVQGDQTQVTFKQIAGLIARRIVFRKKIGDSVAAGDRVGMIKFGSRVDVILGPEWLVTVVGGHRVRGGASIIAVLKSG